MPFGHGKKFLTNAPNPVDWVLNAIIFVVALWFFVELGCLRGTVGPNRYGPDPLAAAPAR